PRAWRVIAMAPGGVPAAPDAATTGELTLGEIQSVVDAATGGRVRLRSPAWLTHFRLHHRQTARYRQGRIFLAGDAAHIHSPVGGQGMNTGIQDAWNLGWKLALVAGGRADPALLDTYDAERWPVGRALLRTTDRAFGLFTRAMASSASAAWLRRVVVPRVLRRVLRSERIRSFAFGFISELRIRYRDSPLAVEGTPAPPAGPRAGDRMPDARVTRGGRPTWLQQQLAGPHLHLLLCGPPDRWDDARLDALVARHDGLLHVHRLTRDAATGDALVDATGTALERLGADDAAQYLVRPDGYIAYRQAGRELDGIDGYLARWFDGAAGSVRA
ncbi:MAG TPA: FAD-dependent monooxygenase, partial [Longimicrobiales bacterium]